MTKLLLPMSVTNMATILPPTLLFMTVFSLAETNMANNGKHSNH